MKKFLIILGAIAIVIVAICSIELLESRMKNKEVSGFNAEFEKYNKEEVLGIDITTLINKAMDNNKKYNVEKKKVGNHEEYVEDEENSIKITIKMILNDTTYTMEQIAELGVESFVEYFGNIKFKCTNVEYHKANGKIAKMEFEAIEL